MRIAAALMLALAVPASAGAGIVGLDPRKALSQFTPTTWTVDQGLPNSTVTAIAQTPDGYLWAATYEGLARFDGVRFTVFHTGNTEGLGSSSVRALATTLDGSLWIGTWGGGLSRYREGRFTRYTSRDGLPSDMVLALHADREGAVWIGTTAGLAALSEGRVRSYGPFRDSVASLFRDRQGHVWVGTHGAGVRRLSPQGRWDSFGAAEGVPDEVVGALFEDREGTLWVGTNGGGLARREGERFVSLSGQGGPPRVVHALMGDGHGALWIATGGAGLMRLHGGRFASLGTREGMADTVLISLFQDREGSVWVGSNGAGLTRLSDGPFTTYTTREGLSHDFVYGIREDAQGVLWAGTSDGLNRFEQGHWVPQPSCGGARHNVVRALTVDRAGALWAGTYGSGVCRFDGRRWTTYTRRDGLAHDSVRTVLGTSDGALWAGTIGGLSVLQEGRWRTFTARDGLPVSSIISLMEDRRGTLWIGTDGGGLARHRGGRFEHFGGAEGLPSTVVLALYEDDSGEVWAATNTGLALWRDGRFSVFGTRAGLPSDAIYQVLDDGRGGLWLGTSRGIARVDRDSLFEYEQGRLATVRAAVFDRSDGLQSAQSTAPAHPAGWRGHDGRLWFATARGVAVVEPAALRRDLSPPAVLIEEVLVDDRELDNRGALRLPAGTERITFHYTAPALLAPQRVRFRYRLEGLDAGWIEARERRVAYYSHLDPGSYRFQVSATTADGAWDETGASLVFSVAPHFYQTRWFLLLCATAGVLLVMGAHRVRVRSLEARERELTRLVAERTRGLQEAKESAEEASREAQRLREAAEEANALKTELLGIAAHDLRNPLQLVSGLSDLMSQGPGGGAKVAEFSEAIRDASQRMLEIVESLLTTAALDRGLELRRTATDLARLAAAVLDDHGPKAASKGQRLLLEAEQDCRVVVDHDRMRQVIDNLVSNAIKFSPRDSDVRVRVRGEAGGVRLEVRDQGPGLTEEDLRRVFGKFARLSARPTGGEPATGLGLAIVKRLVDLHGGRVWVESAPGRGAAFVIELPR